MFKIPPVKKIGNIKKKIGDCDNAIQSLVLSIGLEEPNSKLTGNGKSWIDKMVLLRIDGSS